MNIPKHPLFEQVLLRSPTGSTASFGREEHYNRKVGLGRLTEGIRVQATVDEINPAIP